MCGISRARIMPSFERLSEVLLFSVKFCEVKTQLRLHFFFGRSSHLALKCLRQTNSRALTTSAQNVVEMNFLQNFLDSWSPVRALPHPDISLRKNICNKNVRDRQKKNLYFSGRTPVELFYYGSTENRHCCMHDEPPRTFTAASCCRRWGGRFLVVVSGRGQLW